MVSRLFLLAAIPCGSMLLFHLMRPIAAAPMQSPQQLAQAGQSSSVAMTPSEAEARTKLEQAGYTNIRNVRSGPEGISATATKDGREVFLVIDSGGRIRQR
jgi:hypothetical protein